MPNVASMPDVAIAGMVLLGTLWLWISGVILTAWLAAEKGRSGTLWFFSALFFSPLLCLIALAGAPVIKDEFAEYRR